MTDMDAIVEAAKPLIAEWSGLLEDGSQVYERAVAIAAVMREHDPVRAKALELVECYDEQDAANSVGIVMADVVDALRAALGQRSVRDLLAGRETFATLEATINEMDGLMAADKMRIADLEADNDALRDVIRSHTDQTEELDERNAECGKLEARVVEHGETICDMAQHVAVAQGRIAELVQINANLAAGANAVAARLATADELLVDGMALALNVQATCADESLPEHLFADRFAEGFAAYKNREETP